MYVYMLHVILGPLHPIPFVADLVVKNRTLINGSCSLFFLESKIKIKFHCDFMGRLGLEIWYILYCGKVNQSNVACTTFNPLAKSTPTSSFTQLLYFIENDISLTTPHLAP